MVLLLCSIILVEKIEKSFQIIPTAIESYLILNMVVISMEVLAVVELS